MLLDINVKIAGKPETVAPIARDLVVFVATFMPEASKAKLIEQLDALLEANGIPQLVESEVLAFKLKRLHLHELARNTGWPQTFAQALTVGATEDNIDELVRTIEASAGIIEVRSR
jgi:hypothetical protein